MKKGFIKQCGNSTLRMPYWLTEEQATKLAEKHGGTIDRFEMALPGYGIMEKRVWCFSEATDQEIADREQMIVS